MRLIDAEHVTSATVVPTMLDRIVTVLEGGQHRLPSLRNLAYGGSKVPLPLVRKALELLPHVGFVNAYGLTETSSTIAVLTPDDHRERTGRSRPGRGPAVGFGWSASSRASRCRFATRPAPCCRPGRPASCSFVVSRSPAATPESARCSTPTAGFRPRTSPLLDEGGYLFIGGRSDDTIIRGGENIAPAELEDVLVEHPHVRDVAVVGVEDPQWGQAIVAVVVPAVGTDPDPEELREHVRKSLRGSRTPDRVVFRDELPTNATGKVLRREIVEELRAAPAEQ